MLPVAPNPISLAQVNVELYNSATTRLDMNNLSFRKLASAGNTGQSLTSGTRISLSTLYGHARYNRDFTGTVQNPDIVTDAVSSSRYYPGQTWLSYTVLAGGVIGSTSTNVAALIIPSFAQSGDIVDVIVNSGGYIVGKGGDGGTGGPSATSGTAGGTALQLLSPALITNAGTIGGGGGGGGGGAEIPNAAPVGNGGGGGGGAGNLVGVGGLPGGNPANSGSNGTLTAGGLGGAALNSSSDGGNGGGLGQAGVIGGAGNGQSVPGNGGSAGYSLQGISFATFVVNTGSLLGPTI